MDAKALIQAVEHSDLDHDAKAKLRDILSPEKPVTGWVPAIALPDEVAAKIESLEVGAETKTALRAIALGVPISEAANLSACGDIGVLYRVAVDSNLISLESSDLIQGKRRIVKLADQELEKRLLHDPAKPSMAELNMVSGTSADKIAAFEGWRSTGARGGGEGKLADVLDKIEKAFEGKDLTLKIESSPPERDAIDVTPTGAN